MNMNQEAITTPFPFQLIDVRLFNVQAKRYFPKEKGREGPTLRIELVKGEEPHTTPEFSLWLKLETNLPSEDAPECSINLSIEGRFKAIVEPAVLDLETVEQFKKSDAVSLLWPYLRETLHNLTDRMRLGVSPLPVIDARSLLVKPVDESSVKKDLFEDESDG